MEIISVSLEPEKVQEINRAMELTKIKSRSKIIRTALTSLLNQYKILSELKGVHTVVFMISHRSVHMSDATASIRGFGDIVKTVLHHHSKKGCLDILIAEGDAGKLRDLFRGIQNMKNINSVSCSII
ncbi:MAG: hypothetical protein ABIH83_05800 [Candidatus Micrarchaeota archaeon]